MTAINLRKQDLSKQEHNLLRFIRAYGAMYGLCRCTRWNICSRLTKRFSDANENAWNSPMFGNVQWCALYWNDLMSTNAAAGRQSRPSSHLIPPPPMVSLTLSLSRCAISMAILIGWMWNILFYTLYKTAYVRSHCTVDKHSQHQQKILKPTLITCRRVQNDGDWSFLNYCK